MWNFFLFFFYKSRRKMLNRLPYPRIRHLNARFVKCRKRLGCYWNSEVGLYLWKPACTVDEEREIILRWPFFFLRRRRRRPVTTTRGDRTVGARRVQKTVPVCASRVTRGRMDWWAFCRRARHKPMEKDDDVTSGRAWAQGGNKMAVEI